MGNISSQNDDPLELLKSLDNDILVDDSSRIAQFLCKNVKDNSIVDIVLDNSGYELFTDLCLAVYLMEKKFTNKIRFYVKRYPWFISDVTFNDFFWLIDSMIKSDDNNIKLFGQLCNKYLQNNSWSIEVIYHFFKLHRYLVILHKKIIHIKFTGRVILVGAF